MLTPPRPCPALRSRASRRREALCCFVLLLLLGLPHLPRRQSLRTTPATGKCEALTVLASALRRTGRQCTGHRLASYRTRLVLPCARTCWRAGRRGPREPAPPPPIQSKPPASGRRGLARLRRRCRSSRSRPPLLGCHHHCVCKRFRGPQQDARTRLPFHRDGPLPPPAPHRRRPCAQGTTSAFAACQASP